MEKLVTTAGRLLTAVVLVASVANLTGCPAPQKSPAPRATPPSPVVPAVPAPTDTTLSGITDRVTQLVTGLGVPGYRRADVVVVGNVALIGLDLSGPSGPTATPGAAYTPAVPGISGDPAKLVGDRIVAANLGVTRALVTTDADLTARIGSLSNDIRAGRPVTDRIDEIAAVVKQISAAPGSLPGAFPINPGSR